TIEIFSHTFGDHRRQWIKYLRLSQLGVRLLKLALSGENNPEPMVRPRVSWAQLNRLAEIPFQSSRVSRRFGIQQRQGGMCFGETRIEFQGAGQGLLSPRHCFGKRLLAVA